MATTEERDIPELPALLDEIQNYIDSLALIPADQVDLQKVWAELSGTLLPLLKDTVASTMLALEDVAADEPVEISRADADEIGTLLGALRAHAEQTGNAGLLEKIDDVLPVLLDDEDDEDETEES